MHDLPEYNYIHCDCGGIVGAWDRKHYTCQHCGKLFDLHSLPYDRIMITSLTWLMLPVIDRKE